MRQNIVAPLLNDSRITLPDFKSSEFAKEAGLGSMLAAPFKMVGRAAAAAPSVAGKAVGAAKALPRKMVNAGTQNAADFRANMNAQKVPALTPEAAAANAQAKLNPPAPAPAASSEPAGAHAGPPVGGPPVGSLSHTLSNLTGMKAMGLGAAAGGLKGIIDPGTEYDANGVPHQKSRIGAAVGGAASGAAAGALAAPLIRAGARTHAAMPAAKPDGEFNRITGETLPPGKIGHLLPSIDGPSKTAMLPGGLDATANNAVNGPGGTNTMSVPKVATMAHGKEDMSKGVPAAKAEEKDHTKRVETAKKMSAASGTLEPALNPAIGAKPSAKDKKDAKPAFPNLNLKKK